ncbi:MAG: Holliday junction resolvase RuvX [bacterium]|nr:Holliday junction resolvase RuvX [bacterium]
MSEPILPTPDIVPYRILTTDRAVFRDALPSGGRLIGMDVGTKTIGLALCDAQWSIASPSHTITRGKFTKDKATLAAFILEQQVRGIVIGLPLNLDGTGSPRSQSSRAFAQNLADLNYPILLWDERWSTQAVTRTLLEADASRARRDVLVDKLAASYILQGAIDGLVAGL